MSGAEEGLTTPWLPLGAIPVICSLNLQRRAASSALAAWGKCLLMQHIIFWHWSPHFSFHLSFRLPLPAVRVVEPVVLLHRGVHRAVDARLGPALRRLDERADHGNCTGAEGSKGGANVASEVGRDDTGVQTVGAHPAVLQPLSQLLFKVSILNTQCENIFV